MSRIFLDTNILVNDFLHRYPEYPKIKVDKNRNHCANAVTFIRQRRHLKTYIASFSIARFVSLLSDLKVPREVTLKELDMLMAKNTIVSLTQKLIVKTIQTARKNPKIKDVEDALQYTVCHDNRCYFLLTLNTKDFVEFADISALHPSKCRFIDF
jgi:predicted nucleic acid-binding protein